MEKQTIVQEHNKARQMLALGKVSGQPAALNMREMVWDEELSRIAQRWADQCMPGHDHRRNVGLLWGRTWRPPGPTRGCPPPETPRSSSATSWAGSTR